MTTLQAIELQCPSCEDRFRSQAVASTNSFGGKRTDFHERAAGAQPLPYLVHTCPRCGYTGSEPNFRDEIPQFTEGERAQLHAVLAKFVDHPLTGSEKYEAMALTAMVLEFGSDRYLGDIWLRAAWCCVDEGDVEAERYYRLKAVRCLEDALKVFGGVEENERAIITYLVGELWRRIGDAKRAAEWFNKVEGEVIDKSAQDWVVRSAIQQRDCPREWFG